jgi:hypothetical protein
VKADTQARIAGVLALAMLAAGTFAASVHTRLVVPGDAVKTAANILASPSQFRLAIAGSLILYVAFLVYAVLLYRLLRIVEPTLALLMLALALVGTAVAMGNQVNPLAALQLLSGADYLKVVPSDQLHAQVLLFLQLHSQGNLIGVIFWGLWLFPLGLLVYRSGFLPRILGILLMIGCFGWLSVFLQRFALPNVKAVRGARRRAVLCIVAPDQGGRRGALGAAGARGRAAVSESREEVESWHPDS